jgi:glutamate synthase (NADPH/NADH)
MGVTKIPEDFDDRQLQLEAEAEQYKPYEYQTENNESWAGALPVKQYVPNHITLFIRRHD